MMGVNILSFWTILLLWARLFIKIIYILHIKVI